MTQARGTFTVTSWKEDAYADLGGGAKLTKASMVFGYDGDLRAECASEALMCYATDGTAVFTGLDHLTGELGGRSGSFVLISRGRFAGGEARAEFEVVAGSGTGELAGLRGQGTGVSTSEPPGTFTLDYEIG